MNKNKGKRCILKKNNGYPWPKPGDIPTINQKIIFQISQHLAPFSKKLHETKGVAAFNEDPHFNLISHGIVLNVNEALGVMELIREGYFSFTHEDILKRLPDIPRGTLRENNDALQGG